MTADQVAALLAAIPLPLVLIGADERVVAANAAAEALFGANPVGRHYITALRHPVLLDCVEAALRTGASAQAQFPTRDAARDATFRALAMPLRTPGLAGVMLSLEDIGHVEAANQMRRDFVANVSHELRTPLTALIGFIETLRGPARNDAATQDRFLGTMAREADRMRRLIQDLLSLSRVEAEERMRPTQVLDLAALAVAASRTLAPMAKANDVTLSVTGAEAAVAVAGDADQLLQVFTNLLENAIKYGGSKVSLDVSVQGLDADLRGPAVRVEVADDGAGIGALHLPRLTERFYRVDGHRSRALGGTGLGLAIVKHIVNRHRGRLRIQSAPGQGSRFTVVLPLATPPKQPQGGSADEI